MAYSLRRQSPGARCAYRGSISVISRVTGAVLKNTEGAKARVELNCPGGSPKEIQGYIAGRAADLYQSFYRDIQADYQGAAGIRVPPDTITPAHAVRTFCQAFLRYKYPTSTPKKLAERQHMLERVYYNLDPVPMCKYSTRQIEKFINARKIGKKSILLAGEFWQYCLDQLYANGTNPFPQYEADRISPKTLQSKAIRAATLSTETQANLYKLLLTDTSGMDAGVALLASGFTAEQACIMRWESLRFDPDRPDFVLAGIFLPERAGAQHNYTRPCVPQTALVLNKLHHALLARKLKHMDKLFVTGDGRNRVSPGDLSKYAANKLVQAGLDNDTIRAAKKEEATESYARVLLRNTYRKNLFTRCGLDPDLQGGTIKFLCGLTLAGDVTSSNYTSYTSPEASERLYTILRVLQPVSDIPPIETTNGPDGSVTFHITPGNTGEVAGVVCTFRLPPGWTIENSCQHGLTGKTQAHNNSKRVPNGPQKST